MSEFNVGDEVFFVNYAKEHVKKECPICFGKMRVALVLGNGDIVETDCNFCERGFVRYGYVEEYEYVSKITKVRIDKKEIYENEFGKVVEYRYGCYVLDHSNISAIEDEAKVLLASKIEKVKKEDLERLEYDKKQNIRKYSWHVGYYRRMKREAQEKIDMCDKKIKYFSSMVKQGAR